MIKPGDFGLSHTPGFVGGFIEVGQLLSGDASYFTHAFIYIGEDQIVEAKAKGAKINPASVHRVTASSNIPLTDDQRAAIVVEAKKLVGTPYSFLDYLAIGATRLHFPSKGINKRVTNSGHMICSQLVDTAYERAGVHLFNDGRLPGQVTPGDLANLLLTHGWLNA